MGALEGETTTNWGKKMSEGDEQFQYIHTILRSVLYVLYSVLYVCMYIRPAGRCTTHVIYEGGWEQPPLNLVLTNRRPLLRRRMPLRSHALIVSPFRGLSPTECYGPLQHHLPRSVITNVGYRNIAVDMYCTYIECPPIMYGAQRAVPSTCTVSYMGIALDFKERSQAQQNGTYPGSTHIVHLRLVSRRIWMLVECRARSLT